MEKEQERVEFVDQKIEKKEMKFSSPVNLKGLLSGTVLTRESVKKQFPYILFLVFLAVVYIANRYHAEKIVRRMQVVQQEIKELRAESITTTAELMFLSKQSEVTRGIRANGLELHESVEPPIKLKKKK